MKKDYYLTKSGVLELEEELKELKLRRQSTATKLKTAREFGDLGENAEYHVAREEQVQIESRISEISNILNNVIIIQTPKTNGSVQLGSKVLLKENGNSRELIIVGSVEADPTENKISDESPIGQALLGKKVGDQVEIVAPKGPTLYTVEKIK
jgi:transcription elongation factor GreA